MRSEAHHAMESVKATGVAEAELLATTLREAEARAESAANARLELEARAQAELDRLGKEVEQLRFEMAEATSANTAFSEVNQALERRGGGAGRAPGRRGAGVGRGPASGRGLAARPSAHRRTRSAASCWRR